MNRTNLVLIVAALMMVGCAPPVVRGVFLGQTSTKKVLIMPLGQPLTKEIGETIYEQGTRTTLVSKTAKTLTSVTSALDLGHSLNIPSGTSGRLLIRSLGGEPALCFFTTGVGQAVTSISSLGGQQTVACLVDVNKEGMFDHSMFSTREKYFELSNKVPYSTEISKEEAVENKGAFRVDFLYQGLAKGVLKFSYREFNDGVARPAFSQDLTYDIEADGTAEIGFKGMRIKVIRATNQSITYTIEKIMNI
jgi:hypothetical protein